MEKHLWLVLNFDRESHFVWEKKNFVFEKNKTFGIERGNENLVEDFSAEFQAKMILPEDFFSPKSDSKKKKKFFFKKSGERKIHPDFGKGQKFNHFIFSSPEFGRKSFPAGKDFMGLSFHFQFGESFEF